MRTFLKICSGLSIVAVILILICVTAIFIGGITDPSKLPTYNWNFMAWLLGVSAIVQLITGITIWTSSLNEDVWKSIEELQIEREALTKLQVEVFEIRDKLVRQLLKAETK